MVVVDMNVVAVPIAVVREPCADRDTGRKRHHRFDVRSLHDNDRRLVSWDVDDGRAGRHDGDIRTLFLINNLFVSD